MSFPESPYNVEAKKALLQAWRSEASGALDEAVKYYTRAYRLDYDIEYLDDALVIDGIAYDFEGNALDPVQWECMEVCLF